MPETWKTIPGFPDYEVSDQGRIRSYARGKVRYMKPGRTRKGYLRESLAADGRNHTMAVHRLVLEAFVGPRPAGYQCDHINAVRDDNRLVNLRWVTAKENRHNPITEIRCVANHPRKRPIRCVETGEVFVSVSEAVRALGLHRSALYCVLTGTRKSTQGLHFSYCEQGVCYA